MMMMSCLFLWPWKQRSPSHNQVVEITQTSGLVFHYLVPKQQQSFLHQGQQPHLAVLTRLTSSMWNGTFYIHCTGSAWLSLTKFSPVQREFALPWKQGYQLEGASFTDDTSVLSSGQRSCCEKNLPPCSTIEEKPPTKFYSYCFL